MRISSFEINNYKGLAHAQVSDLGRENVVIISGKNGTGKSLVLEALVSAWTGRIFRTPENVGPWGDTLRFELSVEFSDDEWDIIDDWHTRFSGGQPAPRLQNTIAFEYNRAGQVVRNSSTPATDIVRQQSFQREHGFGIIDFLPATRLVSNGVTQAVDIAMLGAERIEQERSQGLEQVIVSGGPIALPNVGNYLMTLDYQRFLAERQGDVVNDEYDRIATIFNEATGKRLLPPTYDAVRGSTISIELVSGYRHGLNALSSGEKELLAMSYYIRRLSAAGGVLLIDEPEQHLHPTLQSALLQALTDVSERAQTFVVSHSSAIIASASRASLLEVEAAGGQGQNQILRLSDAPSKTQLLETLGLSHADLLQADAILVVEGVTDARWLPLLFPIEVGRTHVVVAGSARQVLQTYEALVRVPVGVPFLCVRDRDLLSDAELAAIAQNHPRLHVWPRRAIESMVLDGALISSTLRMVGKETTPAEIEAILRSAADQNREDVLLSMVNAELDHRFPAPGPQAGDDSFAKLQAHLMAYAQVNAGRASQLVAVRAEQEAKLDALWDERWKELVNPKPVLAALFREVATFKTLTDLVDGLIAKARDDETLMPAGFAAFKSALATTLPTAKA
ncbi:AAA family ATPase [Microbacterium sp. X-17]|uniref:ATP-dependent nuclease n=1 Tax=Microbacterium sp. X-17 TaxID=3144404 RepID=UPI0031F4F3E9